MENLFSIGEVARYQKISKQTLIFYDKIGLFRPDYVDPGNGYRYYSAKQLDYLDAILIMKKIGFSLSEIKEHMQHYTIDSSLDAMKNQLSVIDSRIQELYMIRSRLVNRCQQMEEMRTYAPEDVVPPVLNPLDIEEIVVTEDNLDETVAFVWDAADFGVRAQINYAIAAEYDGEGETRRVTIQSGITSTSHEMTYEDLNYTIGLAADLGGLGVPLETPSTVKFYVGASLGNGTDTWWSAPLELAMSVIYAEPRYPNVWVIGKYSNWDHSRSQFLFSFNNCSVIK